jgi:ribonuclease HII
MKYEIGIDEVGRGPVAGPIVFCACAVDTEFDMLSLFPKRVLKDSKKLSEKAREKIRDAIQLHIESKEVVYGLGEVSARRIDEIGLVDAIKEAQGDALRKVFEQGVQQYSKLFLDGGLKVEGYESETIIKGDEKVNAIALASIIAKVHRDTYMKSVAKKYPEYGFDSHVGYGTKAHMDAIKKYGLTEEHRKSFLKSIIK